MYVCVCKGISEQELLEQVKVCGPSLPEIQKSCGAGTDCGACQNRLKKYLDCTNVSVLKKDPDALVKKSG